MGSLATLTALLYALASPSAQPPTPPSDQIIVNGQKERAEIARFVSQLSPQQADIQLGKFLVPVCPGVVGLPNGQNELVEARMRTVAAAGGAPGCETRLYPRCDCHRRSRQEGGDRGLGAPSPMAAR
jgi:hypothetical protein